MKMHSHFVRQVVGLIWHTELQKITLFRQSRNEKLRSKTGVKRR